MARDLYELGFGCDELDHALEELESLKLRLSGVAGSTADVA